MAIIKIGDHPKLFKEISWYKNLKSDYVLEAAKEYYPAAGEPKNKIKWVKWDEPISYEEAAPVLVDPKVKVKWGAPGMEIDYKNGPLEYSDMVDYATSDLALKIMVEDDKILLYQQGCDGSYPVDMTSPESIFNSMMGRK